MAPKSANPFPADIALVVFDFDGVMTDNRVYVGAGGVETVVCFRSDSLGTKALQSAGVPVMVLSTEGHPVVGERCKKIGVPCHQGVPDKAAYLETYLRDNKIDAAKVVYVGNDVNDLGCLKLVGYPTVVADAYPEVLSVAKVILTKKGGRGAVRECCDLILAAREA